MDGFQSREARNFTSTVCTQPEQHMPYDLPVDEFKHLKAYAVRNRSFYVTSPRIFHVTMRGVATRNGLVMKNL